jgi:hypothetical protein
MKTVRKILIVGLMFGAAVFVGALSGMFNAQAGTPPRLRPTPTPEVLANGWYRFTDREAGYSISYPPETYLDVTSGGDLDFELARIHFPASVGGEGQRQGMGITAFSNSNRFSLEQIIYQRLYHGRIPGSANDIHLTPIKIAGLDAAKMEKTPYHPAILISARGKVYMMSLGANMLSGNPPTQASEDLFYKIINTFSLN